MRKYRSSFKTDSGFTRYNNSNNPCSFDSSISQRIKKLEVEGNKLRSQVEVILNEACDSASSNIDSVTETDSNKTIREVAFSCDTIKGNRGINYKMNEPRNVKLNFSTCDSKDYQLRKDLEEAKDKADFFEQKLKEEYAFSQMEREKMIKNMDQIDADKYRLQKELDDMSRDFEERQQKKDVVIQDLRCHLSRLVEVYKEQEELLTECAERVEELESNQSAVAALEQLKKVLQDIECLRGQNIFNDHNLNECSEKGLVNAVDKCFRDFCDDIETCRLKIRDLEDEIECVKRNACREKEKALMDLRHQLSYQEEQNCYLKKEMEELTERANRDLEKLRMESEEVQMKMESDIANATSVINDLERNMSEISDKYKEGTDSWCFEKQKFEKMVDDFERQQVILKNERDQVNNQHSSITAKLDATEMKLAETETQLLQLQTEKYGIEMQVESLKKRNRDLESSLTATRVYLETISQTVKCSTQGDGDEPETSLTVRKEMLNDNCANSSDGDTEKASWKPKKYEVEEVVRHIKDVNKKLLEVTEDYDNNQKKMESLQKQMESTEYQRKRLEQTVKTKELDIDTIRNENTHISTILSTRNNEIERLTAERDYYFQMLNDKTEEMAGLRTEHHKLALNFTPKLEQINIDFMRLEERCRQLEQDNGIGRRRCEPPNSCQCDCQHQYQQQQHQQQHQQQQQNNQNIEQRHVQQNNCTKQEKEVLLSQLHDIRAARDSLLIKFKDQSRQMDTLQFEKDNLQSELRASLRDYDDLKAENKRLQLKLKDTDNEIASLCHEIQNDKINRSKKNFSSEKRISELTLELSKAKAELNTAKERIKEFSKGSYKSDYLCPKILNDLSSDSCNSRLREVPVKDYVNDEDNNNIVNTQLRLTETKSRLSSLEQQMAKMELHYNGIQKENQKLRDLLKKVNNQNERLSEELEFFAEENKRLREKNVTRHTRLKEDVPLTKIGKFQLDPEDCSTMASTDKQNSIKLLRDDLQNSIKEARKLLSHKYNDAFTSKNMNSSMDDSDNETEETPTSEKLPPKYLSRSKTKLKKKVMVGRGMKDSNNNNSNNNNNNNNNSEPTNTVHNGVSVELQQKQLISVPDPMTAPTPIPTSKSGKCSSDSCLTPVRSARSESASLPEADRHLNFKQLSDRTDCKNYSNEARASSERSFSPVQQLFAASDNQNSYPSTGTYHRFSNRDSYVLEEKIKRILSET